MSGLGVSLALPVGLGDGVASSVLALGAQKTIMALGTIPDGAVLTVEAAAGSGRFAPLISFTGPGPHTFTTQIAATEMRVNVQGAAAASAVVTVVGDDTGCRVTTLTVPAADGVGASTAIPTFGGFKTAVCVSALAFDGSLTVEFSENNTDFATALPSFSRGLGGAAESGNVQGLFARVRRQGFNAAVPGSPPTIDLASSIDPSSGGGLIQAFTYTSAGGENDFNVTLPAARVSDDYVVIGSLGGVSVIFGMDFPDLIAGDRTTALFRVVTTQNTVAGDKIDFVVMDRG